MSSNAGDSSDCEIGLTVPPPKKPVDSDSDSDVEIGEVVPPKKESQESPANKEEEYTEEALWVSMFNPDSDVGTGKVVPPKKKKEAAPASKKKVYTEAALDACAMEDLAKTCEGFGDEVGARLARTIVTGKGTENFPEQMERKRKRLVSQTEVARKISEDQLEAMRTGAKKRRPRNNE